MKAIPKKKPRIPNTETGQNGKTVPKFWTVLISDLNKAIFIAGQNPKINIDWRVKC